MKRLYIIFILALAAGTIFAVTPDYRADLEQSINLYKQQQYQQALDGFNQIINQGVLNPGLFYHAGNCYYRLGDLGYAILNYKKALKLDPGYKPAKTNLAFAMLSTRDKQEQPETDWLRQRLSGLYNAVGLNGAALLMLFALVLCAVMLGLLLYKPAAQRGSAQWFATGLLMVVLVLFAWLTHAKYTDLYHVNSGVLVTDNAEVYSGPSQDYKLLFTISQGMVFDLEAQSSGWLQIKLANGLGGWIPVDKAKLVALKELNS